MIGRILPFLFILVAIGLFFIYINPAYTTKIQPLRTEIARYDSALAAAKDFNRKESELAKERAAIPVDSIERLTNYLPDGVDNVQLILDLNALASRSGVQLSNFDMTLGAAPDTSGALSISNTRTVDTLNLTVKAIGTYSAFRTFLQGVETSLRPLDLIELSVDDSATGVYSYNMTFRIYWLQ